MIPSRTAGSFPPAHVLNTPFYHRAPQAAGETNTALMVHHGGSSIHITEVLGAMRSGDMYTHCFHPSSGPGTAVRAAQGRLSTLSVFL